MNSDLLMEQIKSQIINNKSTQDVGYNLKDLVVNLHVEGVIDEDLELSNFDWT